MQSTISIPQLRAALNGRVITPDGGIVLDLGDLRTLNIDVAGRTAWAETGLTAGEYTTAAGAHGLATGFAWGRFAVLRKAQSNCSQWVGHSFRATSGPA